VMIALALAMFGLYEFALPSSITTKASTLGGGGGFVGAFVVGTVAGIVAAPCTGPIVAYLLLEIAQHKNWGLVDGGLVMATYSLGLGMLFLVIGTFAGVLASMPRSGTWMVAVKKVFGVILIGAGIYYIDQSLSVHFAGSETAEGPVPLITALWALTVLAGAWIVSGGAAALSSERKPAKLLAGLAVLVLGMYVFVVPKAEVPAVEWGSDHDATLATAATTGKPTIVDFTADWCTACKELEHKTYTDPAVIQCSEEFESIMFDATADSPEFLALKERYGIVGLPAVFFICPNGELVEELTLKGFEPADRFLEKMNIALNTCNKS
ncbi:MAG: thioredoxin fold domain-containing protein, partial [Myxococcota bacterium]|nr:thioredoxin fold domain-containing protein [Myxococcota bacterium]